MKTTRETYTRTDHHIPLRKIKRVLGIGRGALRLLDQQGNPISPCIVRWEGTGAYVVIRTETTEIR